MLGPMPGMFGLAEEMLIIALLLFFHLERSCKGHMIALGPAIYRGLKVYLLL